MGGKDIREAEERYILNWRMQKQCDNCPFSKSGKGLHLRRTLHPQRWRSILLGLRRGEVFNCHKTTNETGDGSNLICAGAIDFQERNRCTSNLQRVMERLDYAKQDGATI